MNSSALCLNLGCGRNWREDCLNADIERRIKSDWCLDIQNVPWGEVLITRFGEFPVQRGMFNKIVANDVLEHIPDLVKAMTNCKDLLADDGEMHIHVPYDLSRGAWQDPTHVRAFNEMSWAYYTSWHSYLGWEDRFFLQHLEFRLSKFGESLKLPQDEVLRTPRAVDSMFVILQKGKK